MLASPWFYNMFACAGAEDPGVERVREAERTAYNKKVEEMEAKQQERER